MKRLLCLALVAGLPFAAPAADTMYAYCTVRGDAGDWYVSKVFTVTTDAMQVGGSVGPEATLVASYMGDDLQGQFKAAVVAEGLDGSNANCMAAGSMDGLAAHYGGMKANVAFVKQRFAQWDPEGDFLVGSELWPD